MRSREGAAIIHIHGGWFNLGTAQAFRNFAGHIASRAGADVSYPIIGLLPKIRFLLLLKISKRATSD